MEHRVETQNGCGLNRAQSSDCILSLPDLELSGGRSTTIRDTFTERKAESASERRGQELYIASLNLEDEAYPEVSDIVETSDSDASDMRPDTEPSLEGSVTRPPARSAIVVHGGSKLHTAVASGDTKAVDEILGENTKLVDSQDGTESTPLFYCKTTSICLSLINAGASINHKNQDGLTPLHRHALLGRIAIVCALLEAGADATLLCNRGRSALDVSVRRLEQFHSKRAKQKLKAVVMVLNEFQSSHAEQSQRVRAHSTYTVYKSTRPCCTIS